MLKKLCCLLITLLSSCISPIHAATGSTSLSILSADHKPQVQRCYGVSHPTQQDPKTLTYTDWWRCDGSKVHNQYFTCPAGYVSVGIYTWYFTDMWGRTISRCRAACSQVKAYIPKQNCDWEDAIA